MLQGEAKTRKGETLDLKRVRPLDPEEGLWERHT